jgi:prevent-host-death family protein
MATVTIHAAKTNLSQLLARVEAGEEIILARGKQPIAKLTPYVPPRSKRQFGAPRGSVTVGPEFFEPLPDEELAGKLRRSIASESCPASQ